MIRSTLATATALTLAIGTAQAADSWSVVHDESTLGFIGTQGNNSFTGSFADWDADIRFSPDDLENSAVSVTIQMASADAGSDQRNNALPGSAWFAVEEYPTASFTADRFTHEGGDAYIAHGTLQIRSIAQEVDLPFTLTIDGDTAMVDGSLDIVRTNFNVGTGQWATEETVKFGVEITVDLTATRAE